MGAGLRSLVSCLLAVAATAVLVACGGGRAAQPPNILFVILDDVGIDQLATFGYGASGAPAMPNIAAVAAAGVRFRNHWTMPECSPGRAAFFVGRYPFRTGVQQAIGENDLANSQVSPYDVTVPKLLKAARYESGLFGKFHLAGPDHNEAGHAAPAVLGWDHFHGWLGGVPGSIDTTAGGVGAAKAYACGFVPGAAAGGADAGACHYPDRSCTPMRRDSQQADAPGLQCLASGGIFVPQQACGTPPATLDFRRENGHYVSPLTVVRHGVVEQVPLTDRRARGLRTRVEADAAIEWIRSRPADRPWMATVSFSAAHTPWQPPPRALAPIGTAAAPEGLKCNDAAQGRAIQDQMTEALDTEFGRLLVETGLAKRGAGGQLQYDPRAANTVIVIVSDNGTLGFAVKPPFNAQLAKGTAYQTGIWGPLIVAGPPVVQPGREVNHMVNAVDLFQLFGELAGIDVRQAVPRTLDSVALLPYLTRPEQGSLRSVNFSMSGPNLQAGGARNGPCVLNAASCTQIPPNRAACEDNLGVWWGRGASDPSVVQNGGAGYASCCQVNQALAQAGRPLLAILPESSTAIRNERYKLVQNTIQAFDPASNSCRQVVRNELYEVDQAVPAPKLDNPERNLLLAPLSTDLQAVLADLQAKLAATLASEPACPGDGNKDGRVDAEDLSNWRRIAHDWGLSSLYDFFADGRTDDADGQTVKQNLGRTCPKGHAPS